MQSQSQIEEMDMWSKYLNWLQIQARFMDDAEAQKLVRYFQHRFAAIRNFFKNRNVVFFTALFL